MAEPPRGKSFFIAGFDLTGADRPEELVQGLASFAEEPEKELYCFVCGTTITRNQERIGMLGSHEHTFANPAGFVFRVGCFRAAPGCAQEGTFTGEFSWFPEYAWRYALCGSCRVHLGWVYRNAESSEFYGLILNRLLESKEYFPSDS